MNDSNYEVDLLSELVLCDLTGSFLVEVCCFDFELQFLQLVRFRADLLDLSLVLFPLHLHACHFSSQVLFHLWLALHLWSTTSHACCALVLVLLTLGWVKRCLSK